jgi:hypothetical protein
MMIGRPQHEIIERVAVIRRDFERCYDKDLLRAELYEEQGGICFLCGKHIQSSDSVLCEIEHAIPVRLYAEFDYPIEKACEHANNRRNLFAAHLRCNRAKTNRDYEEWVAGGGPERLRAVPELSDEEIARLRKIYTERSRKTSHKNTKAAPMEKRDLLTKSFKMRLPAKLLSIVGGLATKENCSTANFIRAILKNAVEAERAKVSE